MRRILSAGCCFWFLSFASVATALPKKQSAAVNEDKFSKTSQFSSPDLSTVCVHNEVVYSRGENFTTDNPCETCVCTPPELECVMKTCDLKPGCKTIHVASRCCPESVCECEVKGRIYSNGEKVEEPNPCQVCYCKGGEIKCALITCYSRDDCEPVYVDGMCCPKYDDCPLLETMKNKSASPEPTPVVISDLQSSESDDPLKAEESRKLDAAWVLNATISSTVASVERTVHPSVPTLQIEEITVTPFSDHYEVRGFGTPGENATTESVKNENFTEGNDTVETVEENDGEKPGSKYLDARMSPRKKFNVPLNANPLARSFEAVVRDSLAEWDNSTESEVENVTAETITRPEDQNPEVGAGGRASPSSSPADAGGENSTETPADEEGWAIENSAPTEIASKSSENLQEKLLRVPANKSPDSPTSDPFSVNLHEVREGAEVKTPFILRAASEENSAPGLKMLSAEQIQFLQVGEESPVYVDAPRLPPPESARPDVVVDPSTTPTTVEMTKVLETNNSATVKP